MSKSSFLERKRPFLAEFTVKVSVLILVVLVINWILLNSKNNKYTYESIPLPKIIDVKITLGSSRDRNTTTLHLEDGSFMVLEGMKSFDASDKYFTVEIVGTKVIEARRLCATDTVKTPSEFYECLKIL